jgi:hypothetical protein
MGGVNWLRERLGSNRSGTGSVLAPRIMLLTAGMLAWAGADWISLALYDTSPALGTTVQLLLRCAGLVALVRAVLIPAPWRPPGRPGPGYRLCALALLGLLAIGVVITAGLTAGIVTQYGSTLTIYDSDAAAFNHFNAELVLHGKNPYTADSSFWNAIRQFPETGATPLRQGRYATSQLGPSLDQLVKDVKDELTHPAQRGPEFDPASLHSYPALAFLVYVPGVWAGLPTTVWTSLPFTCVFLLAAGWSAPRRVRVPVWGLLLANSLLIVWTLRGSFEVIAVLPAILAWRTLDRRWVSPVLVGLACAVKQVAWPLVPFYAIVVWKRHGPRAACERLAVAAGAFLLPNLPFALAAPHAWAASMLLPMSLPIFPSGVGIIALARAGIIPLFPSAVYTVLELVALVGVLVWFARRREVRPEVALVVGLLPLLLAWHSAAPYFVVIPALAVYASLPLLRRDLAPIVAAGVSPEGVPAIVVAAG